MKDQPLHTLRGGSELKPSIFVSLSQSLSAARVTFAPQRLATLAWVGHSAKGMHQSLPNQKAMRLSSLCR